MSTAEIIKNAFRGPGWDSDHERGHPLPATTAHPDHGPPALLRRSWHCKALSTIRLAEANRACRCPPVRDRSGFPCPFRRRAMLNSRPAAATAAATGRGAPAGRIDPGQCDRPVRNRPAERRKIVKVRRKIFGPLVMGAALGLAGLATQVLGAAPAGGGQHSARHRACRREAVPVQQPGVEVLQRELPGRPAGTRGRRAHGRRRPRRHHRVAADPHHGPHHGRGQLQGQLQGQRGWLELSSASPGSGASRCSHSALPSLTCWACRSSRIRTHRRRAARTRLRRSAPAGKFLIGAGGTIANGNGQVDLAGSALLRGARNFHWRRPCGPVRARASSCAETPAPGHRWWSKAPGPGQAQRRPRWRRSGVARPRCPATVTGPLGEQRTGSGTNWLEISGACRRGFR